MVVTFETRVYFFILSFRSTFRSLTLCSHLRRNVSSLGDSMSSFYEELSETDDEVHHHSDMIYIYILPYGTAIIHNMWTALD